MNCDLNLNFEFKSEFGENPVFSDILFTRHEVWEK